MLKEEVITKRTNKNGLYFAASAVSRVGPAGARKYAYWYVCGSRYNITGKMFGRDAGAC